MLFRQATEPSDRGNTAEYDRLMAEIKATCSNRATIEMLIANGYLHAGMDQGWLPAHAHDHLTQWATTTNMGPEIAELIARIQRREN